MFGLEGCDVKGIGVKREGELKVCDVKGIGVLRDGGTICLCFFRRTTRTR